MDEGPLSYDKHMAQQRLKDWERRKLGGPDQGSDNGLGFYMWVALVIRTILLTSAAILAVFAVLAVWNGS